MNVSFDQMSELAMEATSLMRPVRLVNVQWRELEQVWTYDVCVGPLVFNLSVPDANFEGETQPGSVRLLLQYSRKAIQDGIVQIASAPMKGFMETTNHNIEQMREDFDGVMTALQVHVNRLEAELKREQKKSKWFR